MNKNLVGKYLMVFQPYPTRSGFISLGVAIAAGLVVIFLIDLLLQQSELSHIFDLTVWLLLILVVLAGALYWTMIAFNLQYRLNRNGLAIQWGPARYLVPFDQIKTIIPGRNLPASPPFKGVNIAGLRFGQGETPDYGSLRFHTTAAMADSLIVVTPDRAYVISPRRPDDFIKAWRVRRTVGPTQDWSPGLRRSWLFNTPLFSDKLAQLLIGLSALICLALFGYLSQVFIDLPPSLPIHFDTLGQARIVEKSTLLLFPAVGVLVLGLNTLLGMVVYYKERVAAYLLWGSTIVMQVSLWAALVSIILE